MEPVSLIIAALVAGATKAATDVAPDTYNGLKALIKRKFSGEPKAEMILEEHERDPETYEAPLKKKLSEIGVAKDREILKAAQQLLDQLESKDSARNKYNVDFQSEVKGVQIGDHNTQTNTFGS